MDHPTITEAFLEGNGVADDDEVQDIEQQDEHIHVAPYAEDRRLDPLRGCILWAFIPERKGGSPQLYCIMNIMQSSHPRDRKWSFKYMRGKSAPEDGNNDLVTAARSVHDKSAFLFKLEGVAGSEVLSDTQERFKSDAQRIFHVFVSFEDDVDVQTLDFEAVSNFGHHETLKGRKSEAMYFMKCSSGWDRPSSRDAPHMIRLTKDALTGPLPVQPAFVTLRRQQLEPHVTQYVFSHMTEASKLPGLKKNWEKIVSVFHHDYTSWRQPPREAPPTRGTTSPRQHRQETGASLRADLSSNWRRS